MITITRYRDLKFFLKAFKKGHFDLLIIISDGGLGKTYNASNILKKSVHKINCHITPLGLYEQGYTYKNKKIWFDDVENLFANDKLIGLLKQFCETQKEKEIQYGTSWDIKKTRNIPKEYSSKSKVLLTVNSLRRMENKGIEALLDRAIVINFVPSKIEILNYIRSCFKNIDEEVLNHVKDFKTFSLRDYIKLTQLKKAGYNNWNNNVANENK